MVISKYDDIIKRASMKAGRDWRLVSAIAYNESRFKPDVVSPKGATGIMQVMPSIARAFGRSADQMTDAEINVETALKLINKIESSLKFAPGTSEYDRLCIVLALTRQRLGKPPASKSHHFTPKDMRINRKSQVCLPTHTTEATRRAPKLFRPQNRRSRSCATGAYSVYVRMAHERDRRFLWLKTTEAAPR